MSASAFRHSIVGTMTVAAAAFAAFNASAVPENAWWKGLNWSKNGDLLVDYWDGQGISYEDWYNGTGVKPTAEEWAGIQAIFENNATPYTATLSGDFVCRNVSAFNANDVGARVTIDLNGHTFSNASTGFGMYFRGIDCQITLTNGTFIVPKSINIGNDNGVNDVFRVVDTTLWFPEAVAVGRGTSTGNKFILDHGKLLLDRLDGHNCWGFVIGEHAGEDGNTMLVCNGSMVTNMAPALYIGQNSSGNLLDVQSGSVLYRENYTHLSRVDNSALQPTNNMLRIEGEGSKVIINSQFCMGENVSTEFKDNNNVLWVGDRGTFEGSNDFFIYSSGNRVVVSNGTFRLNGGFRTATEDNNGVTGTKVVIAGQSPVMKTGYDITFRNASTLRFEIPSGGYVAPEDWDVGADGEYMPMIAANYFNIAADTTLEMDGRAYQRSLDARTTLPLMRLNSTANLFSISDATLAAWNESLPEGFSLDFVEGHTNTTNGDGKVQKIIALTVTPLKGTMILLR